MKSKKQLGYCNYVFSGNLLIDTSLVRTGKDTYEWVSYSCRGIVVFMRGYPIGTSRVQGVWPVGEQRKVHCRKHIGTAQDFDNFIMEKLSKEFEDVEPGMAKLYASNFPIIEK